MAKEAAPACAVIMTTVPDAATATCIADTLVRLRLAACVQELAPLTSTYRWAGKVERGVEIPLLIKTSARQVPQALAELRRLHPYEVPEIITWPIADGLPEYLAWLVRETA